jgi:5-methylcytosine-specific restriction endonuclease McrA
MCLKRDNYTCVVVGCGDNAIIADHIVSRRNGGADVMSNLRSLCRRHDNQVKENEHGKRKSNGNFKVIGCDAQGWPFAITP